MKPLRLYLLLTFALFLAGFALVGALMALGGPSWLVAFFQIAMAWAPTAAFAIVHRKVHPGESLWRAVADRFAARIRVLPLLASVLIPAVATAVVWLGYARITGRAPSELVADLSLVGLLAMFLDGVIRGPLGEELGWRGYLQIELNKRYALPVSSLIVGAIWAVWHLPLWFVSGFEGLDLLRYSLYFAVGLVAFSVIIGYVVGRGGNLLYAILLHQMLNFAGRLLAMDELTVLGGSSAVYVLIALAIALAAPRPKRAAIAPA